MTQHAELIARLEAAEGVTHSLEVEFATHLYENQETFKGLVNYDPELWVERNGTPLKSMDAALALAERVLPGWHLGVQPWFHTDPDRVMYRSYVIKPDWARWNPVDNDWFDIFSGPSAATPPLSACAAILRALEAKA